MAAVVVPVVFPIVRRCRVARLVPVRRKGATRRASSEKKFINVCSASRLLRRLLTFAIGSRASDSRMCTQAPSHSRAVVRRSGATCAAADTESMGEILPCSCTRHARASDPSGGRRGNSRSKYSLVSTTRTTSMAACSRRESRSASCRSVPTSATVCCT